MNVKFVLMAEVLRQILCADPVLIAVLHKGTRCMYAKWTIYIALLLIPSDKLIVFAILATRFKWWWCPSVGLPVLKSFIETQPSVSTSHFVLVVWFWWWCIINRYIRSLKQSIGCKYGSQAQVQLFFLVAWRCCQSHCVAWISMDYYGTETCILVQAVASKAILVGGF